MISLSEELIIVIGARIRRSIIVSEIFARMKEVDLNRKHLDEKIPEPLKYQPATIFLRFNALQTLYACICTACSLIFPRFLVDESIKYRYSFSTNLEFIECPRVITIDFVSTQLEQKMIQYLKP